MKQLILLFVVLLLCLSVAMAEAAEIGAEAPDFTVTTLDGEAFTLSEQRGKVVFINIWATWCGPCVMEMPSIDQLALNYPDDLVVIGISCDSSEETIRQFFSIESPSYMIAWDADGHITDDLYPSMYIPNSIFVSPEGKIVSMDFGSVDYEVMEERFLAALEG